MPRNKKVLTQEQKEVKWKYNHIKGDLISLWVQGKWIVVPTNGKVDSSGNAIMGAGLAKSISSLRPEIKEYLGRRLRVYGNWLQVFPNLKIITLPTKDDWQDKAKLELIASGLARLDSVVEHSLMYYGGRIDHVYVPRLGTGAGGLDWKDVEPLIAKWLGNSSRFTVVSLPEEWEEHYAQESNSGNSAGRRSGDAVDVSF